MVMVDPHTDVADVRKKTVLLYDIFIHIIEIINLLKQINQLYSYTKSQKFICQHAIFINKFSLLQIPMEQYRFNTNEKKIILWVIKWY